MQPVQKLNTGALSFCRTRALRFKSCWNPLHLKPQGLARLQELPQDGSRRLINTPIYQVSMCFGDLLAFEPGANKYLLTVDPAAKTFDVVQLAPPLTDERKRREFLETPLFFGVKDDHMVVLQSAALSVRRLEDYLNWLFREAGVMDPTNNLQLLDAPVKATAARIRHSHVKSVTIGAPLLSLEQDETQASKKSASFNLTGWPIAFVKKVLGGQIKDDDLASAIDGNLDVRVTLSWKRTTSKGGQDTLDKAALAMRSVEVEDLSMRLNDGSTVSGEDLRQTKLITVETLGGLVSAIGRDRAWQKKFAIVIATRSCCPR